MSRSAILSKRWFLGPLFAAALAGCSADPFPTCCDATGIRDVPYTKTYRFNYRTGSFDIVAPNSDRLLGILTHADVLTLMNAASVTQATDKGLISGILRGPRGPLREASLVVSDADGNVVSVTDGPFRNFFYNSLGQVPDFLISAGSTDQGSFTMFNAPPGELFIQLVGGGRGNGRITGYPSAVSVGRYNVLEVFPPEVGVLGVAVDAFGTTNVPNVTVRLFGWNNGSGGNSINTDAGGLFLVPQGQGVPTQANLMLSLAAPNFRTTYHRFETPVARAIARQQAFDPLTLDNLLIYPHSGVQAWAANVGVNIPDSAAIILGRVTTPDGTGVSRAVVAATDGDGRPLADQGVSIFYAQDAAAVADQLNPTLTATGNNARYVIFVPDCSAIAGGAVYLSAVSQTVNLPPVMQTGRAAARCIPGGVFVQAIEMQDFSRSNSTYYTTKFPGRVVTAATDQPTDLAVPVPNARIDVLGVGSGLAMTDNAGTFLIPQGVSESAIEPLLAFSAYTVRVSVRTSGDPDSPQNPAYLPTYSAVVTGLNGGQQDLIVIPQAVEDAICGDDISTNDDSLKIFGLVRDLGAVDESRKGLPVEGVSLQVLTQDGTPTSGRVVYQGSPTGLKTGLSGLFAVCGLPVQTGGAFPPMYQVRVVSEDDSGAVPVEIFGDGVTLVNMVVNKALPRTIPTTGRLNELLGPEGVGALPVSNAALAVLGDTVRTTTTDSGRFAGTVLLGSNGSYIVRAQKDGYLPTLNYQVSTPARLRQDSDVLQLPELVITSRNALSRSGIPLAIGAGIAAGKVKTPGFGPPQELVSDLKSPIRLIAGFFDRDDLYPDMLAVFVGRVEFWSGDGVGGLRGPKHAELRDADANPLAISAVAPADFNLDGNIDLAVIADQAVYAVYGRSDGSFETAQELPLLSANASPYALTVTDLDADGDQDLVVATNGANPLVRFLNKTGVSFATQDPVGDSCGSDNSARPVAMGIEVAPGGGPNAMLIADQDGSLCLYPFNSNGNPLQVQRVALPSPALWMESAFLDLDAISDMVVVHRTGVSVVIGVPNQVTSPPLNEFPFPEGFSPRSALLGDVNRDLREDLLVSGSGGVLFLLGAGNGRFNAPTFLQAGTSSAEMTAADLDGDGRGDLVANLIDDTLVQFRGIDIPASNVRVEARDEAGQSVGQVYYLDDQGAAQSQATATGASGRFVISNVPPGFTMVRVAGGGSGNALVTTYADTVSYAEVNVNPIPGTVTVVGQTLDPIVSQTAGTVAEGIRIRPLGAGTEVRSSSGRGPSDPTTGAFELTLDANSEYILKLEP